MFASRFVASLGDAEAGVSIRFGEDGLELLSVELSIVKANFWVLEVSFKDASKLLRDGSHAAAEIFVHFIVGGNVEGRSVTIVKVVEVGVGIAAVVDNKAG